MSLLPTPIKRVNYLNNKDILSEIHSSKNTYCSYAEPSRHRYDFIVDMPQAPIHESLAYALKPENLLLARETRATRLSVETGTKILADTIPTEDLVFRVMTWDHVPVAPRAPRKVTKKRTAKDIIDMEDDSGELFADLEDVKTKAEVDDMVHLKVNFPPFQHFVMDETGTFQCVGKSHWNGSLENGSFDKDHGIITNKLAKMYIMLCEKYAMKYNWRGYSYREDMQQSAILQLTYVGLRFNEAKSNNPFGFYTTVLTNSFVRVLNSEKRNQTIRDDILEINSLQPSFARQMKVSVSFDGE
jgi:hypothetical protein